MQDYGLYFVSRHVLFICLHVYLYLYLWVHNVVENRARVLPIFLSADLIDSKHSVNTEIMLNKFYQLPNGIEVNYN